MKKLTCKQNIREKARRKKGRLNETKKKKNQKASKIEWNPQTKQQPCRMINKENNKQAPRSKTKKKQDQEAK